MTDEILKRLEAIEKELKEIIQLLKEKPLNREAFYFIQLTV